MNIILLDRQEIGDNRVVLRERRAHHIISVLRARTDATLRVGIINGPIGSARLLAIGDDTVELEIHVEGAAPERPRTDLILALPRPIMLKRILSQAATLGVGRIFLINANRVEKSYFSAGLLSPETMRTHLLHGLEQAGDTMVPEVTVHERFRPFVEDFLTERISQWPTRLIAHPGPFPYLPQAVSLPMRERLVLAVGPEGGWVDFEVDRLHSIGFHPFTLGRRILRVDSAVPALLSQIDLLRHLGPIFPH